MGLDGPVIPGGAHLLGEHPLHLGDGPGVVGGAGQVVHLQRIGLEVEQRLGRPGGPNVQPLERPHAALGDGRALGPQGLAEQLIEHGRAQGPVLAGQQRREAQPLDLVAGGQSAQLQQRGEGVHGRVHELAADGPAAHAARPADDQRHPHGRLVVDLLSGHAVFAGHFAVIADEVDDGVFGQAGAVEGVHHAAEAVVHGRYQAVVPGEEVPADSLAAVGAGGRIRADRHVLGPVQRVVVVGHDQGRMRRAVADHGHERPVVPAVGGEEVDQVVGLDIRLEPPAGTRARVVAAVEDRVEVLVAAVVADERLEPQPPPRRDEHVLAPSVEVPLAEVAGPVAAGGEDLRQERLAQRDRVMVGVHAVGVGVLAGHHRRPERAAQRERRVRPIEPHSLGPEPVHVRRADERVARAAHGVEAHLVGIDDQDVGAIRHVGGPPLDFARELTTDWARRERTAGPTRPAGGRRRRLPRPRRRPGRTSRCRCR